MGFPDFSEMKEQNKNVYLNFGLIAAGPLSEIEKLQELLVKECSRLKIVYQTVTGKRLKLVKTREVYGNEQGGRIQAKVG